MITILRRNQRWLLLLVAILTIIAFAFLYNTTDTEQLSANRVAQFYGANIYRADVDRAMRVRQLAVILGMEPFLRDLSLTAQSEDAAAEDFLWNLFVLRHEADALWIRAGDNEVLDTIRALPALSNNGTFDRVRYADLLQTQLGPRGLTERHLEELIRDSLALRKIRSMVTSPVQLSPREEADIARMFESIDAMVFSLPAVSPESVPAPTAEEIKAYFDQNQTSLLTPPFRSFELVKVALSPEEEKLEGKQKMEALQAAADRVSKIAEAIAAGGAPDSAALKDLAAQHGGVLETPAPVSSQGNSRGTSAADEGSPSGLPPELVAEIFRLSPQRPFGEILQSGDAFFIPRFLSEEAARPMELSEISVRIGAMLRTRKAAEATQQAAATLREKLLAAGADNAALQAAAQAAGATVETLSGLEPWSQSFDPKTFYAQAAAALKPGEISEPSQGMQGYFLVKVLARNPATETGVAAQKAMMRERFLDSKRMLLLAEWFRTAREKASPKFFFGN